VDLPTSSNEMTVIIALNANPQNSWNYVLYRDDDHPPQLRLNELNVYEWNNGREYDNETSRGVVGATASGWTIISGVTGAAVADNDERNNDIGSKFFVNQSLVGIANYPPSSAGSDATFLFNKHGDQAFAGDIGEIAVYSRRLKSYEVLMVEDYMRSKWFGGEKKSGKERSPSTPEVLDRSEPLPVDWDLDLHLNAEGSFIFNYDNSSSVYQVCVRISTFLVLSLYMLLVDR
jgi:hypothetical protein